MVISLRCAFLYFLAFFFFFDASLDLTRINNTFLFACFLLARLVWPGRCRPASYPARDGELRARGRPAGLPGESGGLALLREGREVVRSRDQHDAAVGGVLLVLPPVHGYQVSETLGDGMLLVLLLVAYALPCPLPSTNQDFFISFQLPSPRRKNPSSTFHGSRFLLLPGCFCILSPFKRKVSTSSEPQSAPTQERQTSKTTRG